MSSPSSSIFDRKPLPGIGRQPLQRGDVVDHQVSRSSPVQSDKAVVQADRSPSRTQASSLVGHRLSQHLSVSVGSEDGDEKSQDQKPLAGTMKPTPSRAPVRSREEGAPVHGSAAGTAVIISEHEAMLRVSSWQLWDKCLSVFCAFASPRVRKATQLTPRSVSSVTPLMIIGGWCSHQHPFCFARMQVWLNIRERPALHLTSIECCLCLLSRSYYNIMRRSYARNILGTWMRWSKPTTTLSVRSLDMPGVHIDW